MNETHTQLARWFGEYVETFQACARGESEVSALLDFIDVPLTFATDDGAVALLTEAEVTAAARAMIDGMRAESYDHSRILDLSVEAQNDSSSLCRCTYSRHRSDGTELSRFAASYLVVKGEVGFYESFNFRSVGHPSQCVSDPTVLRVSALLSGKRS